MNEDEFAAIDVHLDFIIQATIEGESDVVRCQVAFIREIISDMLHSSTDFRKDETSIKEPIEEVRKRLAAIPKEDVEKFLGNLMDGNL